MGISSCEPAADFDVETFFCLTACLDPLLFIIGSTDMVWQEPPC